MSAAREVTTGPASPSEGQVAQRVWWVGEQLELNCASAGRWDGYTTHRTVVTDLVLGEAPNPPGRLVVLGAGNCNDLDLARIVLSFEQIHLVDIDGVALQEAVCRQGVQATPAIRLHGDVDVKRLAWQQDRHFDPAHVVVSTALLTQLISTVVRAGSGPQEVLSVRDTHLQTMVGLLRASGCGLLINDVVSSDTCPQLRDTVDEELPALLAGLVSEGNFFTGCNPFAIACKLRTDPRFHAADVGISLPWRWDMGSRSYLVCAIRFRRRPGTRNVPALSLQSWKPVR